MTEKRNNETGADFAKRILSDPNWISDAVQREAARSKALAVNKTAEEPLLAQLRTKGYHLESSWELAKISERYEDLLLVLMEHLNKDYPPLVREGIVRALGKPWAKSKVWTSLIEAYRSEPNLCDRAARGEIGAPSGPKDAMADTIATLGRAEDLDQLIELIQDKRNGPSRILLVRNLARSKSKRAFEALARLSTDEELKAEIAETLRKKLLKPSSAQQM